MRVRVAFSLLGLIGLAAAAIAAAPRAPQIKAETLQRVTRTLSGDAFQGRAPGTEGEARTTEFLAAEFRRAGLTPGNHGGWFQDVPLVEITATGSPQLHIGGH